MSLQYLTNINPPPPAQSVLQYDVEPETVYVSTATEPMYANLTITVSNTTSTSVNCLEFQFGFFAGAATGNLTTVAEAGSVAASSDQAEWGITPQGSFSNSGNQNLYLFTATPSGLSNYLSLAAGASLVFHLNNVLIDQSVGEGTAPFTIIEQTGTSNVSKQTVQGTLPIEKETGTLSITAFNASPPKIMPGNQIELSWTVAGADRLQLYESDTVTLLYDSNNYPPPPLSQWPVPPQTLEPQQTSHYELIAWAGQLFTAQSATAMVAAPEVSAEGPSAKVNALSDVVIQWTSSNAQTVGIEPTGQSVSATSNQGQFTVQPTEDTLYTLTAYDANNNPGPTPAAVEVYVNPPQILPSSFSASSTTCQPGASVNLSWQTESASSVSLSQTIVGGGTNNLGSVDLNSNGYAVTPTGISVYTLTAESQGQATSQTAVAVAELTIETDYAFRALTYDNQNNLIWVLEKTYVYGLNPSDGSVGKSSISLGYTSQDDGSMAIISDGTYLWVSSYQNFVTQIEVSTGKVLNESIPVGNGPNCLLHDSVNNLIWVANFEDGTVSRIDATAGTIVGDAVKVGTFSHQYLLAFDGSKVWVAAGVNNISLVPASKAQTITPTLVPLSGFSPMALAFDGSNVWAACSDNTAKKFDSNGNVLASYPVGQLPTAIIVEGTNLWTVNYEDKTVTMLQSTDGTLLGTFPFVATAIPYQMAFDGSCVWVYITTDVNYSVNGYLIKL